MKIKIIIFFALAFSNSLYCQQFSTTKNRHTADSILSSHLGEAIVKDYCIYNEDTYYEYRDVFGKTRWKTLNSKKRTKRNFISIEVRWNVSIPYPNCPSYDTIFGGATLKLDKFLNPIEKPYLGFIPEFYWRKDSCNFITEVEALRITEQEGLKEGVGELKAYLQYFPTLKKMIWGVSHTLWIKKDINNNDYGELEAIKIDAITGEIIAHETLNFSTIY